jgi:Fe-S-cluster containining protein
MEIKINDRIIAVLNNCNESEAKVLVEYIKNKFSYYHSTLFSVKDFYKALDFIKPRNNSCRRGCNFCCHINVDISTKGAIYIIDEAGLTKEQIESFHNQKGKGMLDRMKIIEPCAFLKNGECSIYDIRPIVCRKYFVVSDPKKCDPSNGFESKVQVSVEIDMEILECVFVDKFGQSNSMADVFIKLIEGKK